MGKRGPKPKIVTQEDADRRIKSGLRMEAYRKTLKMSQEKFAADVLGVSKSSMKRYAGGAPPSKNYDVYGRLQRHSGIHAAYWSGETDIKDEAEYLQYLEAKQRAEEGAALWIKQLTDAQETAERERRDLERQNAFSFFGYRIEYDAEVTAAVRSCADTNDRKEATMWKVTSYDDPLSDYFYCDQAELASLYSDIKNTISFFGYKKYRTTKDK